jgi:hypothetical protein
MGKIDTSAIFGGIMFYFDPMKKAWLYVCVLVGMATLYSCGGPAVKEDMVIRDVVLTAEGPLFEGANTLQGEVAEALQTWLTEKGKTVEDVKQVSVKQVTVYPMPDTLHTAVKSIVVQLAADNENMVKAAVLNPVPEGAASYTLQVAAETDVLPLLKQKNMVVVADAELAADREQSISMKAELVFEITLN